MISNVLLYKRTTVQENETRWPWLIFLHILKIQDLFLEILTLRLYISCILRKMRKKTPLCYRKTAYPWLVDWTIESSFGREFW